MPSLFYYGHLHLLECVSKDKLHIELNLGVHKSVTYKEDNYLQIKSVFNQLKKSLHYEDWDESLHNLFLKIHNNICVENNYQSRIESLSQPILELAQQIEPIYLAHQLDNNMITQPSNSTKMKI